MPKHNQQSWSREAESRANHPKAITLWIAINNPVIHRAELLHKAKQSQKTRKHHIQTSARLLLRVEPPKEVLWQSHQKNSSCHDQVLHWNRCSWSETHHNLDRLHQGGKNEAYRTRNPYWWITWPSKSRRIKIVQVEIRSTFPKTLRPRSKERIESRLSVKDKDKVSVRIRGHANKNEEYLFV